MEEVNVFLALAWVESSMLCFGAMGLKPYPSQAQVNIQVLHQVAMTYFGQNR